MDKTGLLQFPLAAKPTISQIHVSFYSISMNIHKILDWTMTDQNIYTNFEFSFKN